MMVESFPKNNSSFFENWVKQFYKYNFRLSEVSEYNFSMYTELHEIALWYSLLTWGWNFYR